MALLPHSIRRLLHHRQVAASADAVCHCLLVALVHRDARHVRQHRPTKANASDVRFLAVEHRGDRRVRDLHQAAASANPACRLCSVELHNHHQLHHRQAMASADAGVRCPAEVPCHEHETRLVLALARHRTLLLPEAVSVISLKADFEEALVAAVVVLPEEHHVVVLVERDLERRPASGDRTGCAERHQFVELRDGWLSYAACPFQRDQRTLPLEQRTQNFLVALPLPTLVSVISMPVAAVEDAAAQAAVAAVELEQDPVAQGDLKVELDPVLRRIRHKSAFDLR